MHMRLNYDLDLPELLDFHQCAWHNRARGLIVKIVVVLGGVHILAALIVLAIEANPFVVVSLAACGVGLMLFGAVTPSIAAWWSWFWFRMPEVALNVDSRGIWIIKNHDENWIPWNRLEGWYTTERLFVLQFRDATEPIVVPKRCCEPEEWDMILEWASGIIPARNEPKPQVTAIRCSRNEQGIVPPGR
jgi:YcxB-like protein